jgi:hypothetical protein
VFLETIDDDEADRNDEKDGVRYSQPKYSQLLKELDFSHARMVNRYRNLFVFVTRFLYFHSG